MCPSGFSGYVYNIEKFSLDAEVVKLYSEVLFLIKH